MSKVRLTLLSVNADAVEKDVKAALAALYSKPESHFDAHCQHLFELKKPFIHIKKIDVNEANLHRQKLEQIGIVCDLEPLKDALSLVPMDAEKTDNTITCPACEEVTENPEVCDACGVIMKKFAEQQATDEMLQEKLASAERTHERIIKAQLEEDEQRKKAAKKKPEPEPAPAENTVDDYENRFTVEVVEKDKNKILYAAAAAALFAAIGGGYFAHHLSQSKSAEEVDFSIADSKSNPVVAEPVTRVATTEKEPEELIEVTPYSNWKARQASIKELKQQLDALNAAVGMASTMSGLLANLEDPLVQVVAGNYAAKISIEKQRSSAGHSEEGLIASEFEDKLDNSLLLAAGLPKAVERQYALLDLGRTLESLDYTAKANIAYGQAEKMVLQTQDSKDHAEVVIAQVVAAEHQMQRGEEAKALMHCEKAAEAARNSDEDSNWALAFVARGEAGMGQFSNAFKHLEEIQDSQIHTLAMKDVQQFAEILEDEPNVLSLDHQMK